MNPNNFPTVRMRRNRMKSFSRRLVRENELSVNDLIYPIFVTHGTKKKEPIKEPTNELHRFCIRFRFRSCLDMFCSLFAF